MGYTKMNRHNYPDIEGLTEAERAKLDHIDDIEDDLADAYDSTATYAIGDWCIRNGKLYECITAIATAEPFDSTKWRRVAVAELKSNLTDYLDLTKWNHIAGTVTVSTESTGFTEQNVSAIQTAKIVRVRAGRMIFTFYNDGNVNWQCQSNNTKWKTASNDVYSQCYTVKCDFTNGVVGLRYEYVGSSAGSVSLTDIWYL